VETRTRLLPALCVAVAMLGCRARAAERRPGAADAGNPSVLRRVATIPLPGVEGRFDHLAVDLEDKRLFVAALGNDTVEVIDVARNARAGTIKGLHKPQGVAFIPGARRIAVAGGEDGTCRFYDGASLQPFGSLGGLDDADNVHYDAAAKRVYVGHGGGALAAIDAVTMKKVADIKLDAHPESFRLEEHGARIFANLPDAKNSIAVIDRNQAKVQATWRLKEAGANFPMWLDEPSRRLFVGCRKPAKLLVLDTDSGRTVAAVDCVGDTDDLFYDAESKCIYVTGGEGAVSVVQQVDADHYRDVGKVETAPGARTSLFVPELHRLFVAVPHRGKQGAEVRVFDTGAPRP
jgi:YVTN family beta-propeller protein